MAAADPTTYRWVPGSFAIGPFSDLTTAFPHGGTALGALIDVVWRVTTARYLIQAEEFGRPVAVVDQGQVMILEADLRGFDPDAIAKLFPGTYTDTKYGEVGARSHPTQVKRPGQIITPVPLLYSPDNYDEHEAIYFPRAAITMAEEVEAQLGLTDERLLSVEMIALPDGDGVPDQIGLLHGISLA